jgi:hypothetical protein
MRMRLEDVYVEGLEFEPDVIAWMKTTVSTRSKLSRKRWKSTEKMPAISKNSKELRTIEKDWHKHAAQGHYHPEDQHSAL